MIHKTMMLCHSKLALLVAASSLALLTACGDGGNNSLINNPATASNADGTLQVEAAEIKFDTTTFDFGTVTAGEVVTHVFNFTNTGKGPLVISKANASCGCTVPDYPRDPIMPGGSGKISVQFNTTGKLGAQNKTVTVTANTNPSNTELILTGKVLHPAATSTTSGNPADQASPVTPVQ